MLLKKGSIYRDVPKHKLSEYSEKGYSVVNEKNDNKGEDDKNNKNKKAGK